MTSLSDATILPQQRSASVRDRSPPPPYDTVEAAPSPYEQVVKTHEGLWRTYRDKVTYTSTKDGPKRWCSACSDSTFLIVTTILFILIISGIAVGVAIHTSRSSHRTIADPGDMTQVEPPTPTGNLSSLSCPAMNGTTYISTTLLGALYTIVCDADIRVGDRGVNGIEVYDIHPKTPVSSLQACIESCVKSYRADGTCTAVSFHKNASTSHFSQGDCYLKNTRSLNWHVDASGLSTIAFLA